MIKVQNNAVPSSTGLTAIAWFMATQVFLNQLAPPPQHIDRATPFVDHALSPGTYSQHEGLFAARGPSTTDAMLQLAQVFANLAAKQERLGSEFEQVLFDNLWELYAR